MADFVISVWNGEVHTAIEYVKGNSRRERLAQEKFREVIPLEEHEILLAGLKQVSRIYQKQIEKVKAEISA